MPTVVLSVLGILGLYINNAFPASAIISNIIILVVFVASLVFSLWATISLTIATNAALQNQTVPEWKHTFTASSHLIWPFIFAAFLVGIIVFGGTLLLIVPGIIFSVWYALTSYIVILDDGRGWSALKTSKKLVYGRWWGMAARIFIPSIVFILCSTVLRFIVMLPFAAFLTSQFQISVAQSVIVSLSSALIAPLTTMSMVLLYQSAKTNPIVSPTAHLEPPTNL